MYTTTDTIDQYVVQENIGLYTQLSHLHFTLHFYIIKSLPSDGFGTPMEGDDDLLGGGADADGGWDVEEGDLDLPADLVRYTTCNV